MAETRAALHRSSRCAWCLPMARAVWSSLLVLSGWGIWWDATAVFCWSLVHDAPRWRRSVPPLSSTSMVSNRRERSERRSDGVSSPSCAAPRTDFVARLDRYTYDAPAWPGSVADPTGADGKVSLPFRWEMALVNEPGPGKLPNASPLDYTIGRCRDRYGRPGVAYYAVRTILPGEEVTVCFGPNFVRGYATSCTDTSLLGRWSRVQQAALAPFLRTW